MALHETQTAFWFSVSIVHSFGFNLIISTSFHEHATAMLTSNYCYHNSLSFSFINSTKTLIEWMKMNSIKQTIGFAVRFIHSLLASASIWKRYRVFKSNRNSFFLLQALNFAGFWIWVNWLRPEIGIFPAWISNQKEKERWQPILRNNLIMFSLIGGLLSLLLTAAPIWNDAEFQILSNRHFTSSLLPPIFFSPPSAKFNSCLLWNEIGLNWMSSISNRFQFKQEEGKIELLADWRY